MRSPNDTIAALTSPPHSQRGDVPVFAIVARTGATGYEPFLRVEAAHLARLRGDDASGASELAEASRQFRQMGAAGHAERLSAEPLVPAA